MKPGLIVYIVLGCIGLVMAPQAGFADDTYPDNDQVIEDALQIQVLRDRLIAIRDRKQSAALSLKLNEEVKAVHSLGLVGAVITSDRFLAVSATAERWFDEPLRIGETVTDIRLSQKLAAVQTTERVVGFDAVFNRLVAADLLLNEKVLAFRTARNLTVIITTKRAAGFAVGGAAFQEIDFRLHETFKNVTVTARLATVETSTRLLVFQARPGTWSEQARPLFD